MQNGTILVLGMDIPSMLLKVGIDSAGFRQHVTRYERIYKQ